MGLLFKFAAIVRCLTSGIRTNCRKRTQTLASSGLILCAEWIKGRLTLYRSSESTETSIFSILRSTCSADNCFCTLGRDYRSSGN